MRILGDPTLAEAFDDLRRDNYAAWLASTPGQQEQRETLYREAHTLDAVAGRLRIYIANAKIRLAERDAA